MQRFLKQAWFKFFILIIGSLATVQIAHATTVTMPSDDQMIISARAIITGKVLSIESAYDETSDRVFSYITVKVKEVLKGQITERRVVLKEVGGQAGGHITVLYGSPEFHRGEHVLLYLGSWPDGSSRLYQLFLGKFNIVKDPETGHNFVERADGGEQVTTLPSLQSVGGQTKTNRMELSLYKDLIQNRLSVNATEAAKFERTYYRHTPMLATPPGYEQARGQLSPDFALFNNVRWFEPDSGQPVTYTLNPNPAAAGSGIPQVTVDPADVAAAASVWSAVSGCALRVQYGGPLDTCYAGGSSHAINIVSNNCDGMNQPSAGCASILALGGYTGSTSETKVVNGTTFHRISQGFVSCNPYASCSFSAHCDVQYIVTHEMGHALGLAHSEFQQATMYAIALSISRCAGLWTDDENAIRFVYPGTGGGGTPLSVTTTALSSGTVGSAYSVTLAATGGTAPYTWSVVSGALPGGLSLNASTGAITGTPTTAATSSFTVQVQDSASPAATATKALSITVAAAGGGGTYASQFVSQSVPTTLQPGQSFSVTMVWQNTGTGTWNDSLADIYGGLCLISQNPALNVTWGGNTAFFPGRSIAPGQQLSVQFTATAPSTSGTYNFQWIVANNHTSPFGAASTNVAIQVGSTTAPLSVTTTTLPSGTAGTAYSTTLGATGGTAPYTWGIVSGALPGGLSLNASTGVISGTPTTAATSSFTVQARDAASSTAAAAVSIVIVAAGGGGGGGTPPAGLGAQLLSSSGLPTTWTPGQTYTVSFSMKNTGTTTWTTSTFKLGSQSPASNTSWGPSRAVLPKNIPPGSSGTFTLTVKAPTAAGTYNFQWQMVQEGVAFFGDMTPNKPLTIGGGGTPLSVTTTALAGGTAGTAYSAALAATGGTSPYTWSVVSGALPAGLSLNASTGAISGTPTTAATSSFTVQARDAASSTATKALSIVIAAAGGGGGGSLVNNATFVSQTVTTPLATGQTSSVTVTMHNSGTTTWGIGTYSLQSQTSAAWGVSRVNVTSPIAPNGNATFTFTITAPATAGTYSFQWRMAQDGVGVFGALSTSVSVVVSSQTVAPLVLTTATLPNGTRGIAYSQTLVATGGRVPYTWSVTGSLPVGVTLNAQTGVLGGTATTAGSFSFTVTVRDPDGRTASKAFKLAWK